MGKTPTKTEVDMLKYELLGLFEHIQKIRREIAAIRRPGDSEDRFEQMSDELDAIVEHTEAATNTIMENVEAISDLVAEAREKARNPEVSAALAKVDEHAGEIFTACSFQDITGQRITKVVRSLKFVEERVNSLIGMWGRDALAALKGEDAKPADADAALLNGPQLAGQGVSQDDVDRLFGGGGDAAAPSGSASQSDIDKLFG
ncbi:protein phosphatase CheZ [Oleispirillum naphthae]|uniref:protein phosphatase CheZ n=1 Tax=Oleispirillum naphthae TaxID=2838853 RepID=UPI00308224B0